MTYEVQRQAAAKIAEEVQQLSAQIQPLLKGRDLTVQAAVLADLASIWLVGHWPEEAREALFAEFVALVRALVPVSELQVFGDKGHPARRGTAWNHDDDPRP